MSRSSNRASVKLESINAVVDQAVADGLQLKVEDKSAWKKIEGPHGHRIYIQRMENVRQVDLAEFGKGLPGTTPLRSPNGRIQAHLDLSNPDWAKYLRGFMDLMQTLAPPDKKRGGRAAKSVMMSKSVDPLVDVEAEVEDAKARRRALIQKVAAEKGVAISPLANV